MHVVVTGAAGFVGRGLVDRLIQDPAALGLPVSRLSLVDRMFQQMPARGRVDVDVRAISGDLGDRAVLDQVVDVAPDHVFHLASMPGAQAEQRADEGLAANLTAPIRLAHRVAHSGRRTSVVPRFVFASSIAVYGALGPGDVDEEARPRPGLSYGAHKLMIEVLLADLSRRGELDARSLRLPGIVARPATESGHGSAFMSQLFHAIAEGRDYECPVSPAAQVWWMSRERCIDNLLHAATMPGLSLAPERVWQLPVLRLSVGELVDALCDRFGADRRAGIVFTPVERIETLFGRLPPMHTPRALAAGFLPDTDIGSLITAALKPTPNPEGPRPMNTESSG